MHKAGTRRLARDSGYLAWIQTGVLIWSLYFLSFLIHCKEEEVSFHNVNTTKLPPINCLTNYSNELSHRPIFVFLFHGGGGGYLGEVVLPVLADD